MDSYVEKEALKSMGCYIERGAFRPAYPVVIAFTGHKRCGKSTAASYLLGKGGFVAVKFADPLKTMLRSLGLTEEDIEGRYKETPNALLCGKTPRHAMQTLGTEWGRGQIGDHLWTTLWKVKVAKYLARGMSVVCDDLRFPNESMAVRDAGGVIVRLTGAEDVVAKRDAHASESHFDQIAVDHTVLNHGTIAELRGKLDHLLAQVGGTSDTGEDMCA